MQVFATLKLLMVLLEPILAHLRPIWSQKWSPKLVKKCSKKCPKLVQNITPKITKNGLVLDPKLAPKIPQIGEPGLPAIQDRVF